jgi:hypothetical protein
MRTHKADISIEFMGRCHPTFSFAKNIVDNLKEFNGEDCVVEVFNHTGQRYGVDFTLFSRKSIQHLNWQIILLAAYLKENCSVSEFRANAWSSADHYDAYLCDETGKYITANIE